MTVRRDIAQSRCETGMRSLGTDTLPRVCAWCLFQCESGQTPPRTAEPVPESYVFPLRRAVSRRARLDLSFGILDEGSAYNVSHDVDHGAAHVEQAIDSQDQRKTIGRHTDLRHYDHQEGK